MGLVQMAIVAPAFRRVLWMEQGWSGPGEVDWQTHAVVGTDMLFPRWFEPGVPHFLLHVCGRAIGLLAGSEDPRLGFFVASLLFVGVFGAMLFLLFHRGAPTLSPLPRILLAATLSGCFALAESPAALAGWSYNLPPDFFLPFNNPASPTTMAARALSLASVLVTWRWLSQPTNRHGWWMTVVVVLAMAMKPLVAPFVAVAAVLHSVHRRSDDIGRMRVRETFLRLVAPVGLIAALQWVTQQTQPPFRWISPDPMEPEYDLTFVVEPLRGISEMGGDRPIFWAVMALPIAACIVLRREIGRGLLGFTAVVAALSLAPFVLLYGQGRSYSAETLNIAVQAILVFTVIAAYRLEQLASSEWRRWRIATLVLCAVAAPYVVAGIGFWSCSGGGPCLAA